MARPAATPAPQQAAEPGVIGGFCLGVVKVLGWLVLGLVFSILAEWLGMTFGWPEEGAYHSRRMLEAELGYLTASVPQSLVSADPAGFARRLADLFYHYGFEVTGTASGVERLNAPAQPQDATRLKISRILYAPASSYLLAAITIKRNTLDTGAGGWPLPGRDFHPARYAKLPWRDNVHGEGRVPLLRASHSTVGLAFSRLDALSFSHAFRNSI